jgi:hypothetical protein
MALGRALGHWSSPWAHGRVRLMRCEVRVLGRSAGLLVIANGTRRGEPDELWSPGASGVLGHRLLVPGGARHRDWWVGAQWHLAARQDADDSGGCH